MNIRNYREAQQSKGLPQSNLQRASIRAEEARVPKPTGALIVVYALFMCISLPKVLAQNEHAVIDWSKLNLSAQQSKQIGDLDRQWHQNYNQLQPSIADDQKTMVKLLGTCGSDPVEIMALEATIAHKRDQLSALATVNFLKKRQLLTENQQHGLETLMHQLILAHSRDVSAGIFTEFTPDHIQGLVQKVRSIWTVQDER